METTRSKMGMVEVTRRRKGMVKTAWSKNVMTIMIQVGIMLIVANFMPTMALVILKLTKVTVLKMVLKA